MFKFFFSHNLKKLHPPPPTENCSTRFPASANSTENLSGGSGVLAKNPGLRREASTQKSDRWMNYYLEDHPNTRTEIPWLITGGLFLPLTNHGGLLNVRGPVSTWRIIPVKSPNDRVDGTPSNHKHDHHGS